MKFWKFSKFWNFFNFFNFFLFFYSPFVLDYYSTKSSTLMEWTNRKKLNVRTTSFGQIHRCHQGCDGVPCRLLLIAQKNSKNPTDVALNNVLSARNLSINIKIQGKNWRIWKLCLHLFSKVMFKISLYKRKNLARFDNVFWKHIDTKQLAWYRGLIVYSAHGNNYGDK